MEKQSMPNSLKFFIMFLVILILVFFIINLFELDPEKTGEIVGKYFTIIFLSLVGYFLGRKLFTLFRK